MNCPYCGNDTKVVKSVTTADGFLVTRSRRCVVGKTLGPHRFTTKEMSSGVRWSDVLVRRASGDLVAFNPDSLNRELRQAVMRRMTPDQLNTVVVDLTRSLEAALPFRSTPLSVDEKSAHPGWLASVTDLQIAEAMAQRLRMGRNRLAHVLYAMTVLGRDDRGRPEAVRTAQDVLKWLYRPENYPELTTPIPEPAPRPQIVRWMAYKIETRPTWIIKRSGHREPFSEEQFFASLRNAMLGRAEAQSRSRLAGEWVLTSLWGQHVVHSHQLAVAVLDCFRRLDDIAYLRWATVYKNIDSLPLFRDEAIELLKHHSPHLIFDPSAPNTLVR